jgi:hypothetical protein
MKPPTPWNRLGDEAGDSAGGGGADQLVHVARAAYIALRIGEAEGAAIAVRIVRVNDTGGRRTDAPGPLTGEPHRHRGAAVIGMAERNDLGAAGVAARGQDGGFIGLRAAVGEEALGELAARRERCDLLRQCRLRFIRE